MPTFNTTDPKPGYVYDAATDTWFPLLGIAPASEVNRWTKTAAGAETSLSGNDDNAVSLSYTAGTEQVYLNGVLLVRGQDYTASNGTTITGLTALAASDIAEVITFNPSNIITTDAVLSTDFDAKGDLISSSAASTPIRVPVGTDGYVLKANSATTSGLEWAASAADIEGVTAGTGISGGGTSGTVTITNSMATAIDAKGDLVAGTGADAFAKLSVGTNGQVLTAASGEATGLQWATPGGALTLAQIATGNINSGTSVTISSLSSYDTLILYMNGITNATFSDPLYLQINSVASSGNYYGAGGNANSSVQIGNNRYAGSNEISPSAYENVRNIAGNNTFILVFTNCKATGFTTWQYAGAWRNNSDQTCNAFGSGIYTSAAAVSNLKIFTQNTATFNGSGTYTIWGA